MALRVSSVARHHRRNGIIAPQIEKSDHLARELPSRASRMDPQYNTLGETSRNQRVVRFFALAQDSDSFRVI